MDQFDSAFSQINKPKEVLAEQFNKVTDLHNPYFNFHNHFATQNLRNNTTASFVNMYGMLAIYYTSSLDINKDKLYTEDSTQTIERAFHVKMVGDNLVQPDLLKFSNLGITGLDEFPILLHRDMFFKSNYRNLRENGVVPELDPNLHDPVISQRGYTDFNFRGYSARQIFPKASDLIKAEWNESLYEVVSVNLEISDHTFMQRKYFFKLQLRNYSDDHRSISPDLLIESTNTSNYIADKFDQSVFVNVGEKINAEPIPVDSPSDLTSPHQKHWGEIENKDDVLFRPEAVPAPIKNITDAPKYPTNPFGGW